MKKMLLEFRGFQLTILEILVAIIVSGILATLALAAFSGLVALVSIALSF